MHLRLFPVESGCTRQEVSEDPQPVRQIALVDDGNQMRTPVGVEVHNSSESSLAHPPASIFREATRKYWCGGGAKVLVTPPTQGNENDEPVGIRRFGAFSDLPGQSGRLAGPDDNELGLRQ